MSVETISLVHLLSECAKSALAAQVYTHATLNQGSASPAKNSSPRPERGQEDDDDDDDDDDFGLLGTGMAGNVAASFEVTEKPTLATKAGSAATDLVTAADLATQAIIVTHLRTVFGPGLCIIGEEEEEDCKVPTQDVPEMDSLPTLPLLTQTYLTPPTSVRTAEQKKQRVDISTVKVFIDPIDGTSSFVEGILDVPMTLVGITVNGVPVGGVVNRVFLQESTSMSFCLKDWCCVLWGQDRTTTITTATPVEEEGLRKMDCTFSGSVKPELIDGFLDKLEPITRKPEKGAGNKLMLCCAPGYDLCVSVGGSVKKWDTCAPEAFMRYGGGGIVIIDKESLEKSGYEAGWVSIDYDAVLPPETEIEGAVGRVHHPRVDTSLPRAMLACRTRDHMLLGVQRLRK